MTNIYVFNVSCFYLNDNICFLVMENLFLGRKAPMQAFISLHTDM
jgi:hypothetical protein